MRFLIKEDVGRVERVIQMIIRKDSSYYYPNIQVNKQILIFTISYLFT